MIEQLDSIDYKLIEILQKNARTSAKCLAEQVFLSAPATAARMERLERLGIIESYNAQIDEFKMGYTIKAFINLQVVPTDKPVFYPYIESIPNVMECCCVTGDYSMLIKVGFHTTMELDAFICELQRFGRTYTQIVFSTAIKHRGIKYQEETHE